MPAPDARSGYGASQGQYMRAGMSCHSCILVAVPHIAIAKAVTGQCYVIQVGW